MTGIFGSVADGVKDAMSMNYNQEVLNIKKQDAAISRELNLEQLQRAKNLRQQEEKEAKFNSQVVPYDVALEWIPEEHRDFIGKQYKQMGFVDANGNTTIGQMNRYKNYLSESPMVQGVMARKGIEFNRSKIYELNQQIANEQNPKKKQELIGAKQAFQQKLIVATNELNTYQQGFSELTKKYTPESVQAYEDNLMSSGRADLTMLQPHPTAQDSPTKIKEIKALVERGYTRDQAARMVYGDNAPGGNSGAKPPKMTDLTTRQDKLQKELHRIQTGGTLSGIQLPDGTTLSYDSVLKKNDGNAEAAKAYYKDFLEKTLDGITQQIGKMREYKSPESVRDAYRNGDISRDTAADILKERFSDNY